MSPNQNAAEVVHTVARGASAATPNKRNSNRKSNESLTHWAEHLHLAAADRCVAAGRPIPR